MYSQVHRRGCVGESEDSQWDCIPEENFILDKDTLSRATADDDTENLPDIPGSAKRLRLEDRSTTSKRI